MEPNIERLSLFDSDGILYYPNIEFFSVAWLKGALAVWDHVYRIVPIGFFTLAAGTSGAFGLSDQAPAETLQNDNTC